MEAKVTVFNNEEFGEVRPVTIDGEPWFVGKDVAEKLGYANINKAVAMHIDEEDKKVLDFKGFSQNGNTSKLWSGNDFSNKIVVNESGLYSLIFGSKLESAKRFKHWVTDEVLPCIRKNGIYATDSVIDNILNNPDFGIELLTKLKEERVARIEAEKTNAILMHVNKTYTMTEIAKEIGLKSANELNKILAEKKIQYKSNGTWVMYSDYSDLGYESIKQEALDNGHVIYHRRITQLGRKFILGLFDMAA